MAPRDLRIRLEAPGGPEPVSEIWPASARVADVIARLTVEGTGAAPVASAAEPAWTLLRVQTGDSLSLDAVLGDLDLEADETLALVDPALVAKASSELVTLAQGLVELGMIESGDLAVLDRLTHQSRRSGDARRQFLASAGIPAEWLDRFDQRVPWSDPAREGYRTQFDRLPRDRMAPVALHRALVKLRAQLGLSEAAHRRLGERLGFTPVAAEALLTEPPDGPYRDALEAIKSGGSPKAEQVEALADLRQSLDLGPAEHQRMALEVGFSNEQARLLFEGLKPPPRPAPPVERAPAVTGGRPTRPIADKAVPAPPREVAPPARAGTDRGGALDLYRRGLQAAFMDGHVTASERATLAGLRAAHNVTPVDHMKICLDLRIPAEVAQSLLTGDHRPARSWGRLVAGLVLALGAIGIAVQAAGPNFALWPGGSSVRRAHAVRTLPGDQTPASSAAPESPPPLASSTSTSDSDRGGSDGPDATHSSPPPSHGAGDGSPGDPYHSPPGPSGVTRGQVLVRTDPPGARIYVDGRPMGRVRTPRRLRLPVGAHNLTFDLEDHRKVNVSVGVTADAVVEVHRVLEPEN